VSAPFIARFWTFWKGAARTEEARRTEVRMVEIILGLRDGQEE
jgi:hypothetical protein